MTVSIIIPVYKVEAYIERCARSLMEQTFPDIEFIFVDDGSPDGSIEILQAPARISPTATITWISAAPEGASAIRPSPTGKRW